MSATPQVADDAADERVLQLLATIMEPDWYLERYPDVRAAGLDPVRHFTTHGAAESRDPNRWFDSAWYASHYPDVGATGVNPLLHYLRSGAAELRNPHPRFDAAWYVDQHPEAAGNPLIYHLRIGTARGFETERHVEIADYLPSTRATPKLPKRVAVDVVIPVYRGLEQTRRCIASVLADTDRPPGRVIVIDDRSPEPQLSAWLDQTAQSGAIVLIRNRRNLGFVASVNRGMTEAGTHDVALLNSDTEVPRGWLKRLTAHAYAYSRIASVSPMSNNATICGWPANNGGPIALDLALETVDDACRVANAGRVVPLPTTVGFCMYIRRDALDELGLFDEEGFGRGYGEENDFCMRALERGWRHLLACDTFVYHEGSVSFGNDTAQLMKAGGALMRSRYPRYEQLISQHVRVDAVAPYRFAATFELFRRSAKPTILMVCHDLGGGVRRHVDSLVKRFSPHANFLLLLGTDRGGTLTVPALPDHPTLSLPGERLDELVTLLRSIPVHRVHIHHLTGMDIDVRALIQLLDVPFDVTVHDYYAICPQVNLLPWPAGPHCNEPGPATCNACISTLPSNGAKEILSWRRERIWQFLDADRVICPSADVRDRLARFGVTRPMVVAPHEPVPGGAWPIALKPMRTEELRVAVLGVLASLKGAHVVASIAQAVDPARMRIHLIGYTESDFPPSAAHLTTATGKYKEEELPALLAKVRPHVILFPGSAPETYSFTLSAAIASGLPIVASRIGAFPERLQGRPLTWLVEPTVAPEPWIEALEQVRSAFRGRGGHLLAVPRAEVPDFYAKAYLQPALASFTDRAIASPRMAAPAISADRLAEGYRPRVLVIPERFENGALSPCAYIRLLQPLDHPEIGGGMDVVLADAETALRSRADIVVAQRHSVSDVETADALAAHARSMDATLLYDLDDDLLNIPSTHPDAVDLQPLAKVVQRMVRNADHVWVSTPMLASRLSTLRKDVRVVPNGLDERLWLDEPVVFRRRVDPVRILCMGTATHDDDFAIIEAALRRVRADFGYRVSIDMIGVTARTSVPEWINRLGVTPNAGQSYPGFVNWFARQPAWDIGLAPLANTTFNLSKSSIKTLDYAARGMAVLASDLPVYRGSLADGPGGRLVTNTETDWYLALNWLVRDDAARQGLARGALAAFMAGGSLASQAETRRDAWSDLLMRAERRPAKRSARVRQAVVAA
ncbi:MAG: glycosyltransferase [Acetobacteraceae bacterium]